MIYNNYKVKEKIMNFISAKPNILTNSKNINNKCSEKEINKDENILSPELVRKLQMKSSSFDLKKDEENFLTLLSKF